VSRLRDLRRAPGQFFKDEPHNLDSEQPEYFRAIIHRHAALSGIAVVGGFLGRSDQFIRRDSFHEHALLLLRRCNVPDAPKPEISARRNAVPGRQLIAANLYVRP